MRTSMHGTGAARPALAEAMSDEFRLLVAEIAQTEGVSWPEAQARAWAMWMELGVADADAPIPYRVHLVEDWRFVAWMLLLFLLISLAANAAFVWVLLSV